MCRLNMQKKAQTVATKLYIDRAMLRVQDESHKHSFKIRLSSCMGFLQHNNRHQENGSRDRRTAQHSNASDIVFCKGPVYARHHLASICIIKRQRGLHLQLCNANMVRLQSECSQQRAHILEAQSWFSTFSNSFFPTDYFCSATEWRGSQLGHSCSLETSLCQQLAQVALTSAMGLDQHTES